MKKALVALFLAIVVLFSLCSCSLVEEILPYIEDLIGDLNAGQEKVYVDFTPSEKALIKKQVGCDIPFIANN